VSRIYVNDDGNRLIVDCPYEYRETVKDAGGWWEGVIGRWVVTFTPDALEKLVAGIPDVEIHNDVEQALGILIEREDKLAQIRAMSKVDHPVRLKVPGLTGPVVPGIGQLTLYNYQRLGVMYALTNGTGILIADEMGLGKAGSVDSEVLTPSGFVKMGDINTGDWVIGRSGKPVIVTGVYPQGEKDIYRVTFTDGASTECCDEHLWEVNTPVRKNRGNPPLVKTLREIIDSGLTRKNGKKGTRLNWYIPMVDPVQFSTRASILEKLHPYVLGFLLGDGSSSSGRLGLSTADQEIIDRIESLMGDKWHVRKCSGKYAYELSCLDFDTETCLEEVNLFMRENGLKSCKSFQKHVPKEYLVAPIEDRLALLQGLMDSDGTTDKKGSSATFCTDSEALRDAVVWLCRSLGGTGIYGEKRAFYYVLDGNKVNDRDAWVVTVSLPSGMSPFWLPRKKDRYLNERCQPTRAISSVELVGKKQARCISVDAADSLYVADDFIVTHNTLQAIGTALCLKQRGFAKNALIVVPPSLKYNWKLEIEKWTNEPYVVIDGNPNERVAQWLRKDVFFWVVNYELLLEDLFGGRQYKAKKNETVQQRVEREKKMEKTRARARILAPVRERVWDIIALDEAHSIKSATSKRSRNVRSLQGRFRMALTGTPLDGRLEELHSVMQFVAPGLLGSRTRFLQRYAETDFWGKVTKYKRIGEVRNKIAPYFLRRLKKDVLNDLPDKVYSNRIVELSPAEEKLYKQLAEQGHEVTEDAAAVTAIIRCKQFCNSPHLLADILEENHDPINPIDPKVIAKLRRLATSKLDALREILQEVVVENGHKALVFSQYAEMVKVLMTVLDDLGLKYLCIWGDTDKKLRADYQDTFNNDKSIDLMVGTEAMSTGLNFTAADYVILFDEWWTNNTNLQAIDRAHRIGQKGTVTVVRFMCKNTIEERVRNVLTQKRSITSQALGDNLDEFEVKGMSPKELAKLL
jgi:superfamily II DNA or RNA helicase